MSKRIRSLIIPILFTFSGLFIYTYKLGSISSGFHGDEGEVILFSLRILRREVTDLIGVGQHNHPIITYLPPVITMKIFGENIFGARFSSSLIGAIIIPIFYYFVKKYWDQKTALLSTLFLTFSHWNIAINRLALMNNQTVLIGILSFLTLLKAFRSKKNIDFSLAGMVTALNIYFYAGARIIPIIIFFLLIHQGIKEKKSIKNYIKNLALFWGFLVITALPQARFFIKYPYSFFSRFESIYIFNSGPFNFKTLGEQTKKTFNISARGGDTGGQYGYQGRILNPFLLLMLFAGFYQILKNITQTRSILLILWLFLPLIFGEILMVDPFFFPRSVPALPPLFIFIGLGSKFWWDKIKTSPKLVKKTLYPIFTFLILCVIFQNLYIYFIKSEKELFGDPNKYAATKISKYLNTLSQDTDVIFLTAPNLYSEFATIRFLVPDIKRININSPWIFQPQKIDYKKTVFVIYPNYVQKLNEIRYLNPSGELIIEHNNRGDIQFYLLKINI